MRIRSINSIAIVLGLSLVGHGAIAEESFFPLAMGQPIVEANSALIARVGDLILSRCLRILI